MQEFTTTQTFHFINIIPIPASSFFCSILNILSYNTFFPPSVTLPLPHISLPSTPGSQNMSPCPSLVTYTSKDHVQRHWDVERECQVVSDVDNEEQHHQHQVVPAMVTVMSTGGEEHTITHGEKKLGNTLLFIVYMFHWVIFSSIIYLASHNGGGILNHNKY